jgi:hypothetical protein
VGLGLHERDRTGNDEDIVRRADADPRLPFAVAGCCYSVGLIDSVARRGIACLSGFFREPAPGFLIFSGIEVVEK